MASAICGSNLPTIGSIVPKSRQLHDNGFGACSVWVRGLYGNPSPHIWCNFVAFPSQVWQPTEYPPHTLAWLERKVQTWDSVWPDAQWSVQIDWPWQSEEWLRERPGVWRVNKVGVGIV